MAMTLALMFFMFNRLAAIGVPGIFIYGLFLFVGIYSYTTLLDKSKWAFLAEIIRVAFGLALIGWQGDWFGLDGLVSGGTAGLTAYFILSLAVAGYFTKTERGDTFPKGATSKGVTS